MNRPSLAVWKLASCDGCQLSLLDCEDQILALAERMTIAHFTEMSGRSVGGPYDVSLVEGSVSTPADAERILAIRASSRVLVTVGACATAGGIQALRNFSQPGSFASVVYAHPEYVASLETSTPVAEHVKVDHELHGCPIDRHQLLETLTAVLAGRRPALPGHSVCQECKGRGAVCVMVAGRTACLGPVTRAGCGALCPAVGRGCYGCFGPSADPNTASLARTLRDLGTPADEVVRLFSTFNCATPAFRSQSQSPGGSPS